MSDAAAPSPVAKIMAVMGVVLAAGTVVLIYQFNSDIAARWEAANAQAATERTEDQETAKARYDAITAAQQVVAAKVEANTAEITQLRVPSGFESKVVAMQLMAGEEEGAEAAFGDPEAIAALAAAGWKIVAVVPTDKKPNDEPSVLLVMQRAAPAETAKAEAKPEAEAETKKDSE